LLENAFYYSDSGDDFIVAAVQPDVGPVSGGIEVTLIGAGLDTPNLEVFFGGEQATLVENEAGHAVVQIPGHAVGSVDVTITDGNGGMSTLIDGFTYVVDLWVDGITPEEGDVDGGYDVVIRGEGFTGASHVYFGALPASFVVNNDDEITATVPAHSAGTVDIKVHRGGISATLFGGFTYTEDLEIWGFFPVRGSIAGNTYMEIRGKGFYGTPTVEFGGEEGVDVRLLDANTLSVRTPPHPTGAVDLTVEQGGQSVTADTPYTYFNPGSRFGGTWGGPIQGAVNVTVYSYGGAPIEGAYVMLSTNANTPYFGLTDAEEMITLSGPEVYGEQTVTAAAAEHSSTTVQRINAENVTIFLHPQEEGDGEPPQGPPLATFQGRIKGLNKIAEPGPRERLMAVVYTTQRTPWAQNPNPGAGHVVESDGPYTLRSRLGDVAIVALGGLYDNSTNTFRPLRMGVVRYLFAAEGETYNVNIDLDIELNEQVTFKLDHPPRLAGGPNGNVITPYLDFGFEGVFGELEVVTGRDDVLQAVTQPRLEGPLADVSYWVIGGAYTDGEFAPSSEAIMRDVSDTSSMISLPPLPGVPVVTSPPDFGTPIDGLVQFEVNSPNDSDMFLIMLLTPMYDVVWEIFLPGTARSIRFPDFPDMSHLPEEERPFPYPGGTYILFFIGIKSVGVDYDNFSYDLFGQGAADATTIGYTIITF
ncbi:MAG: IPT/TIG domain-containing protein, partial [Bradymonadaceae bacterium]